MTRKLLVAGALALAFGSAQAALVTVTGNIAFGTGSGTGGFEPDGATSSERGPFTFTYQTDTPDSDPSPNRGLFTNPFTAFRMTIAQETRPALDFVLSGPSQVTAQPALISPGETDYSFSVQLRDLSGAYGEVLLGFTMTRLSGLDTESLPAAGEWRGFGGGSANVYALTGGLIAGEIDAITITGSFVVSKVPAPAPLALLAGGVVLAGLARRRDSHVRE